MTVGKLGVGFGLGLLCSLGVMAALAYQAPKPLRTPQRPARVVPLPGEAEAPEPLPKPDTQEQPPAQAVLPDPDEQRMAAEVAARLEALLAEVDLKPNPPFEIPDPPPHEGALIDHPYAIEPPDMVVVEVLEALPGRPITGERLVRPDGTITLDFYGTLHVRGLSVRQIKEKAVLLLRKHLTDEMLGLVVPDLETGELMAIRPADTDCVFVDVTAYNTKVYYVQGDVHQPGRLPFTGHETVLDALNYAGGIAPTADPHDIRLIRPARGSKPPRTYPIDFDAIMMKGDPTANLQLFPGDRLVVGRHPTVRATIAIDRVAAPISTVAQLILTSSYTLRSLSQALDKPSLTADQRRAIVDAWVELLRPIAEKGDAARMDKDTFRNLLRRGLAPDAP
jgi:polysaccharide export outer membrane protein